MSRADPAQEIAALWALDLLDPVEAEAFHAELLRNPELLPQALSYQDAWVAVGYAVPLSTPPADLKAKVLTSTIRRRSTGAPTFHTGPLEPHWRSAASISPLQVAFPWALALVFCSGAIVLYLQSVTAYQQLADVRGQLVARQLELSHAFQTIAQASDEARQARQTAMLAQEELADLREQDKLNKVEIAALPSTVAEYKEGVAVVLWNPETQQGVLKLERMPPIADNKDYQLWVIDSKRKTPVNAGLVKVDASGVAKVEFKPQNSLIEAQRFAISVENKNGSTSPTGPQGPVIMMNN